MGRTLLVSYAGAADPALNAGLLQAQKIQTESALRNGIAEVVAWNRPKLEATSFYRENRGILDLSRGGGYWLWKPYIILEALKSAEKEDVVIYWDAGRVRPNRITRPVTALIKWCREHNGILPGVPILPQADWTKRDCFHLMGCDSEKYWKSTQIQATFCLWSGRAAIEFVSEWLHWCRDRRCLTDDDNECGLANLAGFREHRHDQSVLTNLCVKHGVRTLEPPSIPPGYWTKNINLWSELLDAPAKQVGARVGAAGKLDAVDRLIEAEPTWRTILAHEPDQPFAMHRLGLVCLRTERIQEGIDLLRRAAVALPRVSDVQRDLGSAFEKLGRPRQAIQYLQQAAALSQVQDAGGLFVQLADLSAKLDDAPRAEVAYRQALIAEPDCVPAWSHLADLLLSQSRHAEAIDALRRVRQVRPGDAQLHSNQLHAMYSADCCSIEEIKLEHQAWARRHGGTLSGTDASYPNERANRRTLRIGYISSGFHRRSVTSFIEPVLAHHSRDTQEFEVYCYSTIQRGQEAPREIRARVDAWRSFESDDQAADQIRADGIDILVDLTGHGPGTRLPLLARRLAPVQISWLGYPQPGRMPAIDWHIVDGYLDPASDTDNERLLRLPRTFACFAPPSRIPPRIPSPGGKTRLVTLGHLGDPVDVTEETLRSWCRILRAVSNSRLLLRNDFDPPIIRELAEDAGIDPRRIETVRRFGSPMAYFEAMLWLDIALDTFPRNGHLTGCDALWMGVPPITLTGDRRDSRIGASLLSNMGLTELISRSQDQYEQAAIQLAGNQARLTEYRKTLPDRMRNSALMDGMGFARDIEAAYRQAWEHWLRSPQSSTHVPAETLATTSPFRP